jgi:hypothetical protein
MATQLHSKGTSTLQSLYDWPGRIEAVVISVLPVVTHDHCTGDCQAWI